MSRAELERMAASGTRRKPAARTRGWTEAAITSREMAGTSRRRSVIRSSGKRSRRTRHSVVSDATCRFCLSRVLVTLGHDAVAYERGGSHRLRHRRRQRANETMGKMTGGNR